MQFPLRTPLFTLRLVSPCQSTNAPLRWTLVPLFGFRSTKGFQELLFLFYSPKRGLFLYNLLQQGAPREILVCAFPKSFFKRVNRKEPFAFSVIIRLPCCRQEGPPLS